MRPMKVTAAVAALALAAFALAPGLAGASEATRGARPSPRSVMILDSARHSDANQIDMFVTNVGSFAWDLGSGASGLTYPRGTNKQCVFAGGLWVGAVVNGARRVVVSVYSEEYCPGPVINGTFAPDWDSNPKYRVYKVHRFTGDPADTMHVDVTNFPPPHQGPSDETLVHDSWSDYMTGAAPYGAPVRTYRFPNPDSPGDTISVLGPDIQGDQMLWSVYNDLNPDLHTDTAGSSPPLGIEVQQTTFSFDRQDALGNVAFMKFKIINKGTNTLNSAYVSVWSDPDDGSASDDLVGCDTTLSLGYCYNATNTDGVYGSNPPAPGYDFFQGPIVASPGDTAFVSGVPKPGFRNLPMTSFNKYINGTDPSSADQTYNNMLGLNRDGSPIIDQVTGKVTTFQVPGDPVTGTGWLDSNPADRRLQLSSGPFSMAPGDTQEIVAAVIVGQGLDRLTSITALKFYDRFAQDAFDLNFNLPNPPPAPKVHASELKNEITLSWGDRSETQYNEPGYAFEGYNIYQGSSVAGPWKRIATYDVADNVGIIFDEQFDLTSGVVVNKPVEFGADTGIKRFFVLDQDYIRGGPLNNGTEYYFAVTSYAYGPDKTPKTLENSQSSQVLVVVPQGPAAGERFPSGAPRDTLTAVQTTTGGNGRVVPIVIDPRAITGDVYEVRFRSVPVVTGPDTVNTVVWDLVDVTKSTTLVSGNKDITGAADTTLVDGILWKVLGPAAPGFQTVVRDSVVEPMIDEIAGAGGTPVPPDGLGGPGNHVWHDLNSTGEWLLSAGGGDGGVGRLTRNGDDNVNLKNDIVMRWDSNPGNIGYWAFDNGEVGPLPFGLYEVDPITGQETRLIAALTGGGFTAGVYDYPDTAGANDDSFSGDRATDWVYAYRFTGTYAAFLADAADGTIDNDTRTDELYARQIVASPNIVMPAAGTIIKFSVIKPALPGDIFRVQTAAPSFAAATGKADLSKILVVPNPYFNRSTYELNQFNRRVKFTNLPRRCTIRIFNLAGDLVRTLPEKNDDTSIAEWDLLTDNGIPVASGIYVWHVDAPGIGQKFGKMAVFVEKERLNTF